MNYQITRHIFFLLLTSYLTLYQGSASASALNWMIQPRLDIREIYSDNITLSDSETKSAFVTEFTPGVSLNGTSGRGNVDLNYNLQGLYNAQGRAEVDLYNQLQMNADYEFVDNRFFADSSASVSQQNISNRRIENDNISGTADNSTISTFSISPYWTPHFEGIADGEIRLTYDTVSSSGGNNALSDTNSFSQSVFLQSGHNLSLLSWSLSFNNSKRFNSQSEDISFQDSLAEIRYALGREYSIFARGGHSNNSFASNSNSNNNGFFYTFGGQWEPSNRFRIEAGYGNNKFVTIEISPFNRLHWISTYSLNDVGLNTGSTWSSQLDYTTRRSSWSLGYSETTTTTQQLLLDQQVSNTSNTGFTGNNTTLPTLTDEVFTTQNADISFSFRTGKSNINSRFFKIYRTFELSGNDEEVTGASGSWDWEFTRRTSSNLRLGWQKTESAGLNSFTDNRFDASIFITRRILKRLDGSLGYSYINQDSTSNFNSYTENRITANLSLQF